MSRSLDGKGNFLKKKRCFDRGVPGRKVTGGNSSEKMLGGQGGDFRGERVTKRGKTRLRKGKKFPGKERTQLLERRGGSLELGEEV